MTNGDLQTKLAAWFQHERATKGNWDRFQELTQEFRERYMPAGVCLTLDSWSPTEGKLYFTYSYHHDTQIMIRCLPQLSKAEMHELSSDPGPKPSTCHIVNPRNMSEMNRFCKYLYDNKYRLVGHLYTHINAYEKYEEYFKGKGGCRFKVWSDKSVTSTHLTMDGEMLVGEFIAKVTNTRTYRPDDVQITITGQPIAVDGTFELQPPNIPRKRKSRGELRRALIKRIDL